MADDLHLQHNETLRYACQDQSYWEGGRLLYRAADVDMLTL